MGGSAAQAAGQAIGQSVVNCQPPSDPDKVSAAEQQHINSGKEHFTQLHAFALEDYY
jgi:DUF438 domain-containing protein